MPAYVLVDMTVTDPDRYEDYKRLAGPSVERHGGRYLVRGGDSEVLEGAWQPARVVVLEFPDVEAARRWYASKDYREARAVRAGAASGNFVLVPGV
jgi:uncharacterized protein (DUF1330 family)